MSHPDPVYFIVFLTFIIFPNTISCLYLEDDKKFALFMSHGTSFPSKNFFDDKKYKKNLQLMTFITRVLHVKKQIQLIYVKLLWLQSINLNVAYFAVFSSPCQRQCELLPSLGIRDLLSVNFSHFNLILWNPSLKIAHFVPIH